MKNSGDFWIYVNIGNGLGNMYMKSYKIALLCFSVAVLLILTDLLTQDKS